MPNNQLTLYPCPVTTDTFYNDHGQLDTAWISATQLYIPINLARLVPHDQGWAGAKRHQQFNIAATQTDKDILFYLSNMTFRETLYM